MRVLDIPSDAYPGLLARHARPLTFAGNHGDFGCLASPQHGERRANAWLERGNCAQQFGHTADRLAVHGGDYIAGLNASLGGWTILQHTRDDDAAGGLDIESLRQFRVELLGLDTDPAACDLPVTHDAFQHLLGGRYR